MGALGRSSNAGMKQRALMSPDQGNDPDQFGPKPHTKNFTSKISLNSVLYVAAMLSARGLDHVCPRAAAFTWVGGNFALNNRFRRLMVVPIQVGYIGIMPFGTSNSPIFLTVVTIPHFRQARKADSEDPAPKRCEDQRYVP